MRTRRRKLIALGVAVALAAGGGTAYLVARGGPQKAAALPPVLGIDAEGPQVVVLVAMTLHDDPVGRADSLTLFAIDRTGRKPVALFVPVGTLTQIPAFGYDPVGRALERSPFLQRLALENILGIRIDRTAVLDDVAVGKLIDALGGADVTVSEDVYETNEQGQRELAFARGPQHMDAATAVIYLTERGGQTEVQRFERAQKVWEAILGAGPERVRAAFARLDEDDAEPGEAAALLEVLAAMAARPASERLYEPLPVDGVAGGGEEEAYNVLATDLDHLVARAFAASALLAGTPVSARPRAEIRNGIGTPGAGERAAALLVEGGIKVVLAANASSFDIRSTKITVYGEDEAAASLGERIRQLLGAGSVELQVRGQTVVDAKIVIGKDFVKG